MISYQGNWRVVIEERNAAWDQRIVISGGTADGPHSGAAGSFFDVYGVSWSLQIQHNDGSGWADSLMRQRPLQEAGAQLSQIIESEDIITGGDQDFNDLIIGVYKIGPMFEVTYRPWAINTDSLEMHPDGVFLGVNGIQYMGLQIKNTWGRRFDDDFVLDISNLGRQVLLSYGITVVDSWSAEELDATGQEISGRGILLDPLEVGETQLVYFKLDATTARRGKPAVQFHLYPSVGAPDLANLMRYHERSIFIAEVAYDFNTNEALAFVPEGTLRLKLNAIAVDQRGMQRLCKELIRGGAGTGARSPRGRLQGLLTQLQEGRCDQATLQKLMALICECMQQGTVSVSGGCGCKGQHPPGLGGDQCKGQFLWLPVDFEYSVDTGGFSGQFGPLPFQDPWWKILLLIIAAVAAIVAIIAAATGWGKSQPDTTIGTVGVSSLANVDAALIELNGSRGIRQSVADAITGEPNQNPQVALDAVIPINLQAATAFIGMRVYKSGARTGLTHGVVTSITAPLDQCRGEFDNTTNTCTPDPNHPDHNMTNQIEISADPAFNEDVSNSGDSGSLWLSNENATRNQVVGLHHSGRQSDNIAFANLIQDVLTALNIRLIA